ncbi:MAG: hypothetical protein ACR2O6_01015 [Ilumatobacteraceae bacterium]
MMLLRASSDALGQDVDTSAAVGDAGSDDDGLAAYAVAAHTGEGLDEATSAVRAAVGVGGWVEAAMTVAVFNGLVRTADASGIPLDDGVVSATAGDRAQLGLDAFHGSANTDLDVEPGAVPHPARFG